MNESLENYVIPVLFEMSKTLKVLLLKKLIKKRFKSFEAFILID
jgi:hypothetical protein